VVVTPEVRAAGGLVRRLGDAGLEVVLVHRPRYDDWSFPKGKNHPDEDDETCALREVEEETGLRCRLGDELPSARYPDRKGRPKLVRYWSMEPVAGSLTPSEEVDEARWLEVGEAAKLLTYEHDREVLGAFADGR
jgi:8-oxo-dGTP pyrophosphatase MutT (NUDIX family)